MAGLIPAIHVIENIRSGFALPMAVIVACFAVVVTAILVQAARMSQGGGGKERCKKSSE